MYLRWQGFHHFFGCAFMAVFGNPPWKEGFLCLTVVSLVGACEHFILFFYCTPLDFSGLPLVPFFSVKICLLCWAPDCNGSIKSQANWRRVITLVKQPSVRVAFIIMRVWFDSCYACPLKFRDGHKVTTSLTEKWIDKRLFQLRQMEIFDYR